MIIDAIFSLLFIASLVAVVYLVIKIIHFHGDWFDSLEPENTKIRFRSFVRFYNVNPHRWRLDSDTVTYQEACNFSYNYRHYRFSYVDFWRYKLWCEVEKARKKRVADVESMSALAMAVQADIVKLNAQAERELNKAREMTKNIPLYESGKETTQ